MRRAIKEEEMRRIRFLIGNTLLHKAAYTRATLKETQ
jgi:hypothetical protein